uniref:Putative 30.5 kDa secreted protein n=1 Tax=Culex tarsalis TaxID=7177 RepID=A0A1Q3FAZ7_CULTA
MKSNNLLLVSLAILSQSVNAADWFTLMDANYAAIQAGLAKLNNASNALSQALNQQQQVIQNAFDGLSEHVNRSLVDIRTKYSFVGMTSTELNSAGFKTYVANLIAQFRQTVTNSVMIPAQTVVSGILAAMYDFYGKKQNSECAKQKAADLMQPRISVGRFADCLLANVPFVEKIAKVAQFSLKSANNMVDAGISQLNYCSAGSINCTSVILNAWPSEYTVLIGALNNLQGIYPFYANPGIAINKQCASLLTIDIQDAIQAVRNSVSAC